MRSEKRSRARCLGMQSNYFSHIRRSQEGT
jgi:hypothetical protein